MAGVIPITSLPYEQIVVKGDVMKCSFPCIPSCFQRNLMKIYILTVLIFDDREGMLRKVFYCSRETIAVLITMYKPNNRHFTATVLQHSCIRTTIELTYYVPN